jgi:hypothetical protein
MRKYVIAAAFIVAFVTPALAEEFYVAFDPASHKCTMMHSQPASPMKSMGKFKTEAEAKTAMAGMKDCEQ